MRTTMGALAIAGLLGSGAWAASAGDRWIHIRVDDTDDGDARVDIQVPIAMVSGLMPMLKDHTTHGTIHVDGDDIDIEELRGYWTALKGAKDGEYVTVRDRDAHVRVAKSQGQLLLDVDDKDEGSRVRVRIPVPLVDAALAGGKTIDLNALGKALEQAPSGDLITVDDAGSHVRIWIDEAPSPAREDAP